MKIRSICFGAQSSSAVDRTMVQEAGRFLGAAAARFAEAGFEVQTTRLALTPFAEAGPPDSAAWVPGYARELEDACQQEDIAFVSIGPVRWSVLGPETGHQYASALADAMVVTTSINGTVETTVNGRPSGGAALAAGRVMARLARETPLGFGNFRFCAIAECGPNIPFFPAAYHGGGPGAFTLGLQAADVVRRAFSASGDLDVLERRLDESLGAEVARVEAVARVIESDTGVRFAGTDLTPAPFGTDADSAAGILEDFGAQPFGVAGTLAATAALTQMLKRLPLAHVGYSGLMLPLLEDTILAARASAGLVTVSELLMYSAVCGTGLDTVPLPGDATPEDLGAIVLDVAALAAALRKPLSCRLFPVPGKAAGDLTEYDSPYLVNGRVLPLKSHDGVRLFERFGP
ncbi:MAG: DUF711 family protein [Chloroflexota bacterium]